MKKKILSLIMVMLLVLGCLSGCGVSVEVNDGSADNQGTVSEDANYQDEGEDSEDIQLQDEGMDSEETEYSDFDEGDEPYLDEYDSDIDTSEANLEGTFGTYEEDTKDYKELIDEDGLYTTKEDVSLYLYTYGHLPDNFITKKEAKSLGWEGGSLEPFAPGCSIGGDYFGNYEGNLPEDKEYHECDIDTMGASKRGAKRLIFSDDGCIYYTGDHYEHFELLYGEE